MDSDDLLLIHAKILEEKTIMNGVFSHFYDRCLSIDKKLFTGFGKRIEIGAGVSILKKNIQK